MKNDDEESMYIRPGVSVLSTADTADFPAR